MSEKDNGGPAFPGEHFTGQYAYHSSGLPPTAITEPHLGMSLRDYFAAKAPLHELKFDSAEAMADFSGRPVPTSTGELVAVAMACAAKASYLFADAMLRARGES